MKRGSMKRTKSERPKPERPVVRLSAIAPDAQLIGREVLLGGTVVVKEGVQLPEAKWEYVDFRLTRAEARALAVELLDPERQ